MGSCLVFCIIILVICINYDPNYMLYIYVYWSDVLEIIINISFLSWIYN